MYLSGSYVTIWEILYDNDIACRALCDELGVAYKRVPMPNTDALL